MYITQKQAYKALTGLTIIIANDQLKDTPALNFTYVFLILARVFSQQKLRLVQYFMTL